MCGRSRFCCRPDICARCPQAPPNQDHLSPCSDRLVQGPPPRAGGVCALAVIGLRSGLRPQPSCSRTRSPGPRSP
ncbi:hypothetical protein [Alloactinosynnema sp. L-07]|nr:hypothetical protein [Alloactinosynnema sp. L-07]